MGDNQILLIVSLELAHVLALLVIVLAVARIVYLFLFNKVSNRNEKVITIGLVAWLFQGVVNSFIVYPLYKLLSNAQILYYLYYDYSTAADKGPAELSTVMNRQPFNGKLLSFTGIFHEFPLANLLLAIASAVVIYQVLLRTNNGSANPFTQLWNGWKGTVTHFAVYNTFIFVVLFFSLYLVISVFITIPYLNEMRKPSKFNKAMVDSVLKDMSKKDSLVSFSPPTSPFLENFEKKTLLEDSTLKQSYQLLVRLNDTAGVDNKIKALQVANKNASRKRIEFFVTVQDFGKNFRRKRAEFIQKLVIAYEAREANIAYDKAVLYTSTVRYFQSYLDNEKTSYDEQKSYINYIDAENRQRALDGQTGLQEYLKSYAEAKSPQNPHPSIFNWLPDFRPYTLTLPEYNIDVVLDAVERNGSDWGIFGWIAGYLIKTKSSELVLLIGMFGFGILGASILLIVTTDDFINSFMTEPLIKNFANVLARGFGAALVVYLATKGGLTIFTGNNNSDPNGYILLLTCFVGAIYSEKVWKKMSNYFTSESEGGSGNKR